MLTAFGSNLWGCKAGVMFCFTIDAVKVRMWKNLIVDVNEHNGAEAKTPSLNSRELLFEVISCHWSALLEEERERESEEGREGRKEGLNVSSSHTEAFVTRKPSLSIFFLEISIHGNAVGRLEPTLIA